MHTKTEGRQGYFNIMRVFGLAFLLTCVLTIVLLVGYSVRDKIKVLESSTPRYIKTWEVTDLAGESFTVDAPYRDPRFATEDFTIVSTLPDDIKDGSYLCFITRGSVDVYIDGDLRKSFDVYKDISLPGGTVKNFYMVVPLEPEDSGMEVKMTRIHTDRRLEIVPETFVADSSGIHDVLVDKYGVSFIMSLMLLALSGFVMLIAVGVQIGYRRTISLMYASAGIFVTAGWLITDSYLYPFVFGHYHIDGVINYILCMLLPHAFLLYIDSLQKGRYRKVVVILLALSNASLFLFSLLHFTGIFKFRQALAYIDIILGIAMLGVFVILIMDIRGKHAGEYIYTLIGFLGFFVFGMITIFMLSFMTNKNEGVMMLLGLIFLLACVIMQQIADLRRMSAERERAIRLSDTKTRFLAGMSHEIRTPINSILGMNEMILRENKDPVIDSYARTIQNSSRMLLSLVNDVLDFSKIEAGKMEIVNEEFDLGMMLSETETIARERAQSKGLAYTTVFLNAIPRRIRSDEVRIRQILVNFINNAVKYTDDGSVTLMISGSRSDNGIYDLRFDVKDTGRGIRAEDKASLFDAFSRIDMKKNRSIEGTGLGLAIVKSIVDSMNGRIFVESEYSAGSTFSVILPVKAADDTLLSSIPEEAGGRTGVRKDEMTGPGFKAPAARLLAVDDNNSNLSIVKLFLKRTGIIPDMCLNGNDALKMCKEKKYDLILLDHMMPDPDGIETLKLIRSDEASLNKETPAIVLTANAIAGSRQIYMDAGFSDYLTKPLNSGLLEETVRNYLSEEKIISDDSAYEEDDPVNDASDEAAEGYGNTHENGILARMTAIEGLDYDVALSNAGDSEELLEVIAGEITKEYDDRISRMKGFIKDKNYKGYEIEAHALKGLMATIGVSSMSERAREHEKAAEEGDTAFIEKDAGSFLAEYEKLCKRIAEG